MSNNARSTGYLAQVERGLAFALFFIWELLLANLRVAYEVVTPRHRMRPGVIAVPLHGETDLQIVLLVNLLTLTPGTLTLDVSEDRRMLYMHAMHIDDVEAFRHRINDTFERRLLQVWR
jgi:multicomponent Na+:H+ antiporter subunit E